MKQLKANGRERSGSLGTFGRSNKRRVPEGFNELVHGWYESFDSKDRKYYWHRKKGITQWDVPDEILQHLPPLPYGWSEFKDEQGKAFYVNKQQRKIQRARPSPTDAETLEKVHRRSGKIPKQPEPPAIPPSPLSSSPVTSTIATEKKKSSSRRVSSAKAPLSPLVVDVSPPPVAQEIIVAPPPQTSQKEKSRKRIRQIRTDDLQEGWVVVLNNKKHRAYFRNEQNKQSSWDVPTKEPLPEGWKARLDYASGRRFYINTASNKVQWTYPISEQN